MNYGYYTYMDNGVVVVEYFGRLIESDRFSVETLLKGLSYA